MEQHNLHPGVAVNMCRPQELLFGTPSLTDMNIFKFLWNLSHKNSWTHTIYIRSLRTDMYILISNMECMTYLKQDSCIKGNSNTEWYRRGIMKSPTHPDYGNISASLQTSPSLLTISASNMRVLTMRIIYSMQS